MFIKSRHQREKKMRTRIITRDVKIAGETRSVEFLQYEGSDIARSIKPVANFQKTSGAKVWKKELCLFVESNHVNLTTTILNRSGYRAIGWNNDDDNSEHSSAR